VITQVERGSHDAPSEHVFEGLWSRSARFHKRWPNFPRLDHLKSPRIERFVLNRYRGNCFLLDRAPCPEVVGLPIERSSHFPVLCGIISWLISAHFISQRRPFHEFTSRPDDPRHAYSASLQTLSAKPSTNNSYSSGTIFSIRRFGQKNTMTDAAYGKRGLTRAGVSISPSRGTATSTESRCTLRRRQTVPFVRRQQSDDRHARKCGP